MEPSVKSEHQIMPVHDRRGESLAWIVVAGALALLLWSRLRNLSTPLWNDEAYSVVHYMSRGPHGILFGTYVPNDHVLFELLGWLTTKVFGSGEVQYRLWSVLPGIVAVTGLAYWARRWFGMVTGVLVLVFATLSLEHLTLVPQARGYGLAMLAATILLIGGMHADRREDTRSVVLCAIAGTIGVLTLPIFAVAYATHMALLAARPKLRWLVVATFGASTAVCLGVYAPILGEIRAQSRQDFGTRLGIAGPISGPYNDQYRPLVKDLIPRGEASSLVARVAVLLVVVILVALGVRVLAKRGGLRWTHITLPILITYTFITIARYRVSSRFTSYLLVYAVLVFALGGAEIWRLARNVPRGRPVAAAVAALLALSGARAVVDQTRAQTRTPWENARFVADVSHRTPSWPVIAKNGGSAALPYYVGSQLRLVGPTFMTTKKYCDMRRAFVLVIERPRDTPAPDVGCLVARRARHLRAPQQIASPIGHRDLYDVWLVPAAGPAASP
jgi:Dolichyl-phosphate-mannose-protein mannosyltransferase